MDYSAAEPYLVKAGFTPDDLKNLRAALAKDESARTPAETSLIRTVNRIPDAEKCYRDNGWTPEMFEAIVREVKIWLDFARDNGFFGLPVDKNLGEFGWILAGFAGQVLRLGRLECNNPPLAFFDDRIVLRNKKTKRTVTLIDSETSFTSAGFAALPGEPAAFSSVKIERTASSFLAFAAETNGRVSPKREEFLFAEWDILAEKGDLVINLHIPADGPLSPEACMDSFRRMYKFYTDRGFDIRGFTCDTWLLDPVFPEILPPESNLLSFAKFGALSHALEESDAVNRVFGLNKDASHPELLSRDTSMRRRFADFLQRGGRFRSGRFFIPAADVAK